MNISKAEKSSLIRLASTFPVGDEDRRSILSTLKVAAVGETYIVREPLNRRDLTFYGPFQDRDQAIVRAALTFASEDFLALYRNTGHRTKKDQDANWSIQDYQASELEYYLAHPEEAGWDSAKLLDVDKLPLTGAWANIFKQDGPYGLAQIRSILKFLPQGVSRAPGDGFAIALLAAAEEAGVRS